MEKISELMKTLEPKAKVDGPHSNWYGCFTQELTALILLYTHTGNN